MERIPQELLIDLVEAADHSIADVLFKVDYTTDTPVEQTGWFHSADMGKEITKGTSRSDYALSGGEGPFRDADFPIGVYSPEHVDSYWGVENLIDRLEDEKLVAYLNKRGDSAFGISGNSLWGFFDMYKEDEERRSGEISDQWKAVVNTLGVENLIPGIEADVDRKQLKGRNYKDNVEPWEKTVDEHHLNTLIHEMILHGVGGSHNRKGGTFYGHTVNYHQYAREIYDALEGTPELEALAEEFKKFERASWSESKIPGGG